MSSFVQRTYDQLSQDLCLNNSPITMLVHWGGISGADCTHLCTFDIAMISNIPNLVYLAPTCKEEYLTMLKWSVEQVASDAGDSKTQVQRYIRLTELIPELLDMVDEKKINFNLGKTLFFNQNSVKISFLSVFLWIICIFRLKWR